MKNTIVNQIYRGIAIVASRRALNNEQREDFLQEGILSALECIDKYGDKPMNELIKITSRAAFNKICDIQKNEICWNRRYLTKGKTPKCFDKYDDIDTLVCDDINYESVEVKSTLRALCSKLDQTERKILSEKLNPSTKTIDILENELVFKNRLKKSGFLVMNVHTHKVTNSHIAKSIGISKATCCRKYKKIVDMLKEIG